MTTKRVPTKKVTRRNGAGRLENLIKKLHQTKVDSETLQAEYRTGQVEVIEILDGQRLSTVTVEDGDKVITATRVGGETTAIDYEGLKREIGAKLYNRILTATPDQKKLEALVVTGEIDPHVVAAHTIVKPRSPHLRFTIKETK